MCSVLLVVSLLLWFCTAALSLDEWLLCDSLPDTAQMDMALRRKEYLSQRDARGMRVEPRVTPDQYHTLRPSGEEWATAETGMNGSLFGASNNNNRRPLRRPRQSAASPACLKRTEELDEFLQRTVDTGRQQLQNRDTNRNPTDYTGGFLPTDPAGVRVKYVRLGTAGASDTAEGAAANVEAVFASLRITRPEEGVALVREWFSQKCRTFLLEVEECDRWFTGRGCTHMTCANPLSQPVEGAVAAAPAPSTNWGPPAAPPPRKEDLLKMEKEHTKQMTNRQTALDITVHVDQRLSLEPPLAVENSFPILGQMDLTLVRPYVLSRLRRFAQTPSLSSYVAGGGERSVWTEAQYPCDAYILVHFLLSRIPGIGSHVVFGLQTAGQHEDLRLHVGSTTTPYFHVRYEQKVFPTHNNNNSLFEAVLLFAAAVRVYYAGRIETSHSGALDLRLEGLQEILEQCSAAPVQPQASRGRTTHGLFNIL
ncbi:hypothetical protein AGDE_13663 [Angomonas deanei]|uniref:Uncharacterized protein n=1 Tax=Angomonas deanei TaxID=59799 RepID=A0A7G2CNF9_9TRYP|nr:hypothetical protein AGDE_13663 [Angomonas deanei]CAD2220133.1 hypothetical protein, conserved [Angomonas deanei]|eukprot:EPY21985.1 hypothetical protein AGDE_13663 [Angomonas deanei]